ncbi:Protein PCF11 [Smittium culicis]|uniref:Protein PCF11 n=1 Tax=Smittium culicis TaxID=133412 RepID=A0A1R1YH13_9FUNG|nr:Protein PCF11 [Smittium culicis]
MAYIPRQNNRPPKFTARNNNPAKNFDEPKSNSYINSKNFNDQRNQSSITNNNDPIPNPNINNRSEKKSEISSSNSINYKDTIQPPPLKYNNNSNIPNHSQISVNFNPTNQYANNSEIINNSSRPNNQHYSAVKDYNNIPSSLNSSNFTPNPVSALNYNSPAVSDNSHFSSNKNSAPSGYPIFDNNNNLIDAKNPINSHQLYPPLTNANSIPNINPLPISNHLNNNLQHLFTNNIQNVNYNNKFPTHSALNQHIPPFNPNNFLIESLKASGLYQNISSIVPNFNNSDSQLNSFKPKIELIAFDSNSLKINRPDAYKVLFTDYPTYCSQCGWRTAESSSLDSKPKMRAHLDWHFRNNRKLKENSRRKRPRGWFINQSLWLTEDSLSENSTLNHDISPFDSLSANKNSLANSSSNELNSSSSNLNPQSGNNYSNKSPNSNSNFEANSMNIGDENRLMLMQKTVAIPEGNTATYCLVCKEPFKSIWNDSEEEWYYTNAVLKDGTIIHSTCAADMKNVLCSLYFLYIYTSHPPPHTPLFKHNLSTNLTFCIICPQKRILLETYKPHICCF